MKLNEMKYPNELGMGIAPQQNQLKYNNLFDRVGFYEGVRKTLLACRIVGLLPISGLRQPDSQLTWHSWNTPYTIIYASGLGIFLLRLVLLMYGNMAFSVRLLKIDLLCYLAMTTTVAIQLARLSKNWNEFLSKIEEIEKNLPPFQKSYVNRMNLLTIAMIGIGLGEHLIYEIFTWFLSKACFPLLDDSGLYYKSYVKGLLADVYLILPFDYFTSLFFLISKIQSRFMWSYGDILVMVSSYYLIERFKNFNKLLKTKEQALSSNPNKLPWCELQYQYTELMKLVELLDRYLNPLVFVTYINIIFVGKDIYYVLTKQMMGIIMRGCTKEDEQLVILGVLYRAVTSSFVILRLIFVSSLGSHINTLSRKPLDCLYTIPASAYDRTFQRFIDQVYHSRVGLSGLNCFYVTREMLLTTMASLLTYELMLFQNSYLRES